MPLDNVNNSYPYSHTSSDAGGENIVGMEDLQIRIPLLQLVVALRMEQIEYEPEQFPGLIYQSGESDPPRVQEPRLDGAVRVRAEGKDREYRIALTENLRSAVIPKTRCVSFRSAGMRLHH